MYKHMPFPKDTLQKNFYALPYMDKCVPKTQALVRRQEKSRLSQRNYYLFWVFQVFDDTEIEVEKDVHYMSIIYIGR